MGQNRPTVYGLLVVFVVYKFLTVTGILCPKCHQLLTFFVAFFTLVYKPSFSQNSLTIAIYPLLRSSPVI